MRRDCSQRQGSLYFGTTHSQLAVGQKRIQFIPPHPYYGSEEPVSVAGCYTSTFDSTNGLEGLKGPECGSRSSTELTSQDFGS